MNIYGVYDNDTLICKGDVRKVADHFNATTAVIYTCERRKRLLDGKYDVKLIGTEDPKKAPEEVIVKMKGFDKKTDDVIKRMEHFGNTILPTTREKEAEKYIAEIEARGYRIKVDKYMSVGGEHILVDATRPRRGKIEYDFIVSLI